MRDDASLLDVLADVASGRLTPGQAAHRLQPESPLGFARVDLDRERRCGFPEVIFGPGKTVGQIAAIAARIFEHSGRVLATRVTRDQALAIQSEIPSAEHHETAAVVHADRAPRKPVGRVVVVSAGTADLPVAEEAAVTATALGAAVERVHDVGVAGIHRLLSQLELLRTARVVVVAAGMEGALASVVGGLVACPVIAVPTSVGYGASLRGLAALLTMLNSCAPNVSVVNIDNGFGAGYSAALVNRTTQTSEENG